MAAALLLHGVLKHQTPWLVGAGQPSSTSADISSLLPPHRLSVPCLLLVSSNCCCCPGTTACQAGTVSTHSRSATRASVGSTRSPHPALVVSPLTCNGWGAPHTKACVPPHPASLPAAAQGCHVPVQHPAAVAKNQLHLKREKAKSVQPRITLRLHTDTGPHAKPGRCSPQLLVTTSTHMRAVAMAPAHHTTPTQHPSFTA